MCKMKKRGSGATETFYVYSSSSIINNYLNKQIIFAIDHLPKVVK